MLSMSQLAAIGRHAKTRKTPNKKLIKHIVLYKYRYKSPYGAPLAVVIVVAPTILHAPQSTAFLGQLLLYINIYLSRIKLVGPMSPTTANIYSQQQYRRDCG